MNIIQIKPISNLLTRWPVILTDPSFVLIASFLVLIEAKSRCPKMQFALSFHEQFPSFPFLDAIYTASQKQMYFLHSNMIS